jgi:hypothetical protein
MFDVLVQPAPLPVGVLIIVLVLVGGAAYWWARKSAKHPEYAARKEATVDHVLQRLIDLRATPDVVDAALAKLRDVDLARAGAAAYTGGQDVATILETHAKVLIDQARKLRGQP